MAVFVLLQVAFSYATYGQFLPNTYLLKVTGFPFFLRLQNGISFILPFLGQSALLIMQAVYLCSPSSAYGGSFFLDFAARSYVPDLEWR